MLRYQYLLKPFCLVYSLQTITNPQIANGLLFLVAILLSFLLLETSLHGQGFDRFPMGAPALEKACL